MKKIFAPSIVLNVILLLVLVLIISFYPGYLQGYRKSAINNHNERKVSHFNNLPDTKNEIIFLGASIVEGANWAEMFQNPNIKNRGIGGNKTADVLARLSEITASKPAKIFIQCGFNDLNHEVPQEDVLTNYSKIFTEINKASPETSLYLISLLPVRYELLGDKVKNERIIILNGKLKEMAEKRGITFIDMFSPLEEKDGNHQLAAEYTNDGLHLTADGYTRFKALLQRFL